MSTCLNDERVQAVADGEATSAEMEHLRGCAGCSARVADAHAAVAEFGHHMSELPVPPMLGARVAAAAAHVSDERRGATTLRGVPGSGPRRMWVVAGGAVAAAIIAGVFVLFPAVDPSARLNAAEILDRSLQTLTRQGVEALEYELSIDAPSAMAGESGTFRVEQLIDHESGRWRFARFAPDGTLLNGISEDPPTGTREIVMRVDGRNVRFRFTIPADQRVRLWDLQRRSAETMIRLVQASAGHVVTEQVDAGRTQYVVELPEMPQSRDGAHAELAAIFDLSRARFVIDATDFHVVEFSAAAVAMGESVSVGFRLIERVVAASLGSPAEFELPRDAAAIELTGEGTSHVPHDVLMLLLRGVAGR